MDTRRFRLLVTWNIALTVVLFISLGANAAFVQASADPPVKIFHSNSEDSGIDSTNIANKNVSSTTFTPIGSVAATLSSNHVHYCIITASVGADWNGQGKYTIGIGYDNQNDIFHYTKREFEFIDQVNINSADYQEVTTLMYTSAFPGNHTWYLLAKKNTSNSSYLVVDRAVMTVICLTNNI